MACDDALALDDQIGAYARQKRDALHVAMIEVVKVASFTRGEAPLRTRIDGQKILASHLSDLNMLSIGDRVAEYKWLDAFIDEHKKGMVQEVFIVLADARSRLMADVSGNEPRRVCRTMSIVVSEEESSATSIGDLSDYELGIVAAMVAGAGSGFFCGL
jgi:hypothetical protein